MQILGTLVGVIRFVIGLALLGWFAFAFFYTQSMKEAEMAAVERPPPAQRELFASEPTRVRNYGSYDPYSAPTDDTRPTDEYWED